MQQVNPYLEGKALVQQCLNTLPLVLGRGLLAQRYGTNEVWYCPVGWMAKLLGFEVDFIRYTSQNAYDLVRERIGALATVEEIYSANDSGTTRMLGNRDEVIKKLEEILAREV